MREIPDHRLQIARSGNESTCSLGPWVCLPGHCGLEAGRDIVIAIPNLMNWITAIWSSTAAVCLTLAMVHFLVWAKSRGSWPSLLFGISCVSASVCAVLELELMHAPAPGVFGELLRWYHVPLGILVVSLVWFVRLYLKAGRVWLAWLICGFRLVTLVLTFSLSPNLNFREITGLRPISAWGEIIVSPIGVKNPWTNITHLAGVLLMVYVVDAAIAAWRQGRRRQGLVVGLTIGLGNILGIAFGEMMNRGGAPIPFTISLVFLIIVIGMTFELGMEVLERHRLVLRLRESEERMAIAAAAANMGLWEWDVERDEVWANEVIGKRLGFDGNERPKLERLFRSIHPDDLEKTLGQVHEALEGSGEWKAEYRSKNDRGEYRWISSVGRTEMGPDGKPQRVRGVSIDITEQKEAEFSLRQSEERYRVLFERSKNGIIFADIDSHRFKYVNPAAARMLGYTVGEMKSLRVEDIYPPEVLDSVRRRFEAQRSGLIVEAADFPCIRKDGSTIFAEISTGLFNEYGETYSVKFFTEVTRRKEMENALRESEQRFRATFEQAAVGIAHVTPEGRFVRINRKFCEILGYSEAEMLERGVGDITHPDDLELDLKGLERLLRGEIETHSREKRCLRKDGSIVWVSLSVSAVRDEAGTPEWLVSVIEDITVTKETELEAQRLAQELAHISRVTTMGQLSSALAHELNQPLGAILRNAEAAELILKMEPPDLQELREIVSDIKQDDHRAGTVIDHMRSLLKKREFQFERLSLDEVVGQVGGLLNSEVQRRRASLTFDIEPGLPPVSGDLIHLQQVLINLVTNALDAVSDMPEARRRLRVQARRIAADAVEVSLRDRGPGIPEEHFKHVFSPFVSSKSDGMGLGLAICNTIIAAHGGRIWAENNALGGATFRFTLRTEKEGNPA